MNRLDHALGSAAGILAGLKKAEMSRKLAINVKLTPTADPLPEHVPRYFHPCHQHRFFMSFCRYPETITCDNINCKRNIQYAEVYLTCPKCEIDLCAHCFSKPLAPHAIPFHLSPDDEKINDHTFFVPFRFQSDVNFVEMKLLPKPKTANIVVPNRPISGTQASDTFAALQGVNTGDDDDDDEEDME